GESSNAEARCVACALCGQVRSPPVDHCTHDPRTAREGGADPGEETQEGKTMSRLPRPFIPYSVRVMVAERQVAEQFEQYLGLGAYPIFVEGTSLRRKLMIM